MKPLLHCSLVLALSFPLLACAVSDHQALAKEMQELTNDLSCDEDQQCKSVGFGHRPCGGFSDYLIYSTKVVTTEKMEALSKQYLELDKKQNASGGMMSICSVLPPKVAQCVQNQCVEVSSGNLVR